MQFYKMINIASWRKAFEGRESEESKSERKIESEIN